jgi:hypothetical protein
MVIEEGLLGSIARGAVAEGVDDVEGTHEAEGVTEERGLRFCRLVTLQFFFIQYSKLEQMINNIVFLIINNVLNFSTQPKIKVTNFILHFLMYPSTNRTLLQLSIIILDRQIPLV